MKSLVLLFACCSLGHSAVLWNYTSGLHTTVIETNGIYLFRYNYTPEKTFQFPNKAYVSNYRIEYEKETFEYGESNYPPIWGTVNLNGKTISTYVPIPEPSYMFFMIGGIGLIWKRNK